MHALMYRLETPALDTGNSHHDADDLPDTNARSDCLPLPDSDILQAALSEHAGKRIRVAHQVRGYRAQWQQLAITNAEQYLGTQLANRSQLSKRFETLRSALDMEQAPHRLECFDISHTRGERTVASCVVFEAGVANKSKYRRFNIDGIEPGDDYAAMRQALTRRFKRVKNGEDYMPDLLLIDGGKGQLGVAVETLEELDVTGVNVIGVAKGSTRKPGLEQIFLPGAKSPLILPADSPGLHLIQQIRDEAHRFAIAGHRGQRGKARQGSMLDGVDGLGPKRRKKLLQTFGGPKQVARAGVSELARVEGISATMAQRIYDHFHNTA